MLLGLFLLLLLLLMCKEPLELQAQVLLLLFLCEVELLDLVLETILLQFLKVMGRLAFLDFADLGLHLLIDVDEVGLVRVLLQNQLQEGD